MCRQSIGKPRKYEKTPTLCLFIYFPSSETDRESEWAVLVCSLLQQQNQRNTSLSLHRHCCPQLPFISISCLSLLYINIYSNIGVTALILIFWRHCWSAADLSVAVSKWSVTYQYVSSRLTFSVSLCLVTWLHMNAQWTAGLLGSLFFPNPSCSDHINSWEHPRPTHHLVECCLWWFYITSLHLPEIRFQCLEWAGSPPLELRVRPAMWYNTGLIRNLPCQDLFPSLWGKLSCRNMLWIILLVWENIKRVFVDIRHE